MAICRTTVRLKYWNRVKRVVLTDHCPYMPAEENISLNVYARAQRLSLLKLRDLNSSAIVIVTP